MVGLKSLRAKKNSLPRKAAIVFLLVGLFFPSTISAYELSFEVSPGVMFPFLSSTNSFSPVGFQGFFDTGVNVNSFMNVGVSFGFFLMPKSNYTQLKEGVNPNMYFVPVGARLEFFGYPGSRIELCGGLALGVGIGVNDIKTMYAPWYKAYGDVLFRLNPNVSIGANVFWFDYQSESFWGNPGMAGLGGGIIAKFKLETEKMVHRVKATVEQDERVYPLLSSIYKENAFGTINIENQESAEIKNVKVSFRSPDFTASDLLCGQIGKINKRQTVQVQLVADFNSRIMQFSESGEIPCEVVIEYELLGKKRNSVEPVIISVYNRNQVRWVDPAVLSAYVAPKSNEVMELSKYLVGVARNQLRSGLNRNLQFAMYLFEGIRLNGIECKPDNSTPYEIYHADGDLLDYIQYPFQTLLYKSGDVDDIGILFMTMLESVGIEAGYIPLSDDFIVLIDLKTAESKVGSMMDGADRVVLIDGSVWIPVSMSTLREGFVNSWYNAVTKLALAADEGEDETFYMLQDGWQYYPTASVSSNANISDKPLETLLTSAVETDMARYITAEFGPQIAAIQYQIKAKGMSVELLNKLGLLYVKAGIYSSAIPVYEKSASMGSVSAMNNLGNIASIQGRYADAKVWYEKALATEPSNATALKGLNRVLGQLEE